MEMAVLGQQEREATDSLFTARNLNTYLDYIWQHYFSDLPRVNEVQIAYCYPWKNRLGLIRLSLDNATSFIGINALLQHRQVPEYVLITTIAHELTHYAHGFGSPLPRLHKHPHANNIVTCELEKRGLGEYVHQSDAWIDKQWFTFYDEEYRSGWTGIPGTYRSSRRQPKSEC
ncbi:MAG: hypothetical protein ACJ788_17165 [Ktedonobacteraceae bacterium]